MGNCESCSYRDVIQVQASTLKVGDVIKVEGLWDLKLSEITPANAKIAPGDIQYENYGYIYCRGNEFLHFRQITYLKHGGGHHIHQIKTNSGSRKYGDSIINNGAHKYKPMFHEESKLSNGTIASDISFPDTNMQLKGDTSTDIYGNLISEAQFRNFTDDE